MFGYLETSRACDTFLNFIRLREVSFFEIKRDFLDSLEKERGQVYVGIEGHQASYSCFMRRLGEGMSNSLFFKAKVLWPGHLGTMWVQFHPHESRKQKTSRK